MLVIRDIKMSKADHYSKKFHSAENLETIPCIFILP